MTKRQNRVAVGKYPSSGIFLCMCGTCKHREDRDVCIRCQSGMSWEEEGDRFYGMGIPELMKQREEAVE